MYQLHRDSGFNVSAHTIKKCAHVEFNVCLIRSKDRFPVKELEMCDSLWLINKCVLQNDYKGLILMRGLWGNIQWWSRASM